MHDNTFTTRDDFEYWLSSMDDFLEFFLSQFPNSKRKILDYSPQSLDVVEAWILEHYPDTDSMLAVGESERVNAAACYVGETFRKAHGGRAIARSLPMA